METAVAMLTANSTLNSCLKHVKTAICSFRASFIFQVSSKQRRDDTVAMPFTIHDIATSMQFTLSKIKKKMTQSTKYVATLAKPGEF